MSKKPLPATFIPAGDDIADVFEIVRENENGQKTTAQVKFDDLVSDLNDNSDDAELRLYRQTVLGGRSSMPFLDSFPVDKFSFSQLQKYIKDTYGGGEYRIHVRANGKLVVNRLLEIEAPTATEKTLTPIGEASSILATVLERQEKMHQQMMQLMQAQNVQPSRREMLDELLLYKQLFDNGGNSGGGNAFQQMRDMMGFLSEMGVTINGQAQEKDEPGFGDLLEKFTPVITAAMSQPTNPQNMQRKHDPMFAQKMMLKNGIGQLMRAAAKNSPREVYADLVLDQLPENTVKEFITAPDAFEKLIRLEPRAAHYRAWFLDLAEHVKAALGMPSQYADLYGDDDDAINAGNDIDPAPTDDGTDNV